MNLHYGEELESKYQSVRNKILFLVIIPMILLSSFIYLSGLIDARLALVITVLTAFIALLNVMNVFAPKQLNVEKRQWLDFLMNHEGISFLKDENGKELFGLFHKGDKIYRVQMKRDFKKEVSGLESIDEKNIQSHLSKEMMFLNLQTNELVKSGYYQSNAYIIENLNDMRCLSEKNIIL